MAGSDEGTDRACLFLNHVHTEASNRYMHEVADTWNYGDNNHCTDIRKIVDRLPPGTDLVVNVTEHWKTDEKEAERLAGQLDSWADRMERYDRHIYCEKDDNRLAVMRSFEPSVKTDNYHFLVAGVPWDYEIDIQRNITIDELIEFSEVASWLAPAHIFAPNFKIPDELLISFFERAEKKNVRTAIGYTTGYTPLFNSLSHGHWKSLHTVIDALVNPVTSITALNGAFSPPQTWSIYDYANEYEVPILPEADLHTVLPEAMQGAGVVTAPGVMDALGEGAFPVVVLLESTELLRFPGKNGISWYEFFTTFPGVLPLYSTGIYSCLFPYSDEEFRNARNSYLRELSTLTADSVQDNTVLIDALRR